MLSQNLNGNLIISYRTACCRVEPQPSCLRLYSVNTPAKDLNRGFATGVMNQVIAYAKRVNKPVSLNVSPFSHANQSFDALVKFYERFGFKRLGETRAMVFTP